MRLLPALSLVFLFPSLTVSAIESPVARGNYPDIAVGPHGRIHLVYGREEKLYYRFYDPASGQWSAEEFTSVIPGDNSYTLNRADPDIVVDSRGRPHVHAWDGYAIRESRGWKRIPLLADPAVRFRDSELAIDSRDTVYLTKRGGFNGGKLGLQKKKDGAPRFVAVTDPDLGLTSNEISNHVYPDLAISPLDDSIHLIQRHGPGSTTAYRRSLDGGKTWNLRNTVSESEPEAPHIVVDSRGTVFATHGRGECFRLEGETWISEGQVLASDKRDQPELSVDGNDVLYVSAFGGGYNTRWLKRWQAERRISPVTGKRIGFVETAGAEDFAWVVWEEGDGVKKDELATQPAAIFLGQVDPQGRFTPWEANRAVDTVNAVQLKRYGLFEATLENKNNYQDPFRDVRLEGVVHSPAGRILKLDGFYAGGSTWKFRFRPDQPGTYTYEATFTDGSPGKSGAFEVSEEVEPFAPVTVDPVNPIWFRRGVSPFQVRALHVGDRMFAENWPEENRQAFLDWFQKQGYNTLSIASHYLNRDEPDRGRPWKTPRLWPLNTEAYDKMEAFLDELERRGIVVFPFAGFIGKNSDYPERREDLDLYVSYTLARIGHYRNTLYNVAGPEPNLRDSWYPSEGVERIGRLIRDLDIYHHPLTVHNRTGDDPYRDSDWSTFGTVQGPKTPDRAVLSAGLLSYHHPAKPLFAQETLWSGNMYHIHRRIGRDYTDDDIRRHAIVIKQSGASFCFADNDGNSSSGFSGSLNLNEAHPTRHDIIHRVWDFYDSLPFQEMNPRQDLVDNGYCLADPGNRYLVYIDERDHVNIETVGGPFQVVWIPAKDFRKENADVRKDGKHLLTPDGQDDWFVYLEAK